MDGVKVFRNRVKLKSAVGSLESAGVQYGTLPVPFFLDFDPSVYCAVL
jgi:hypothetical protein